MKRQPPDQKRENAAKPLLWMGGEKASIRPKARAQCEAEDEILP